MFLSVLVFSFCLGLVVLIVICDCVFGLGCVFRWFDLLCLLWIGAMHGVALLGVVITWVFVFVAFGVLFGLGS